MSVHGYRVTKKDDEALFSLSDEEVLDIGSAATNGSGDGACFVSFQRHHVEEAIQFDEINEDTRDIMEELIRIMDETGEDYLEYIIS